MKLLALIFLLFSFILIAQSRPAMMEFNDEIKVDEKDFIVWSGYVIDSTYWHVWNPDGSLPKRENGTYLYWKADANGNLIPRRKIDYRLPIFKDQSVVMKREEELFNSLNIEH